MFQTYDITSCNISYYYCYISLYYLKEKKSRKIDKNKNKLLIFKHIMIISFSQDSASRETCLPFSFHLTQLLSKFFKYLSSNFPLSYLNKTFAVYFLSNLLLLNISASRFNVFFFPLSFLNYTLFISSSLIFFLKFFTKSIIFSKFSNPSQVSSSTIYYFYLTKYFNFSLTSLLFNIFSSTSYFFSPFINKFY